MKMEIHDLKSQTEVVIRQLMNEYHCDRTKAANIWFSSNTKRVLENNQMFYVSGMRCYIELQYELGKNPKWMREPFD